MLPSEPPSPLFDHGTGANELRTDNEGHLLRVVLRRDPTTDECSQRQNRTELVQFNGDSEIVLGYFEDRVNDCSLGTADYIEPMGDFGFLIFNPVRGEVRFKANSYCDSCRSPGPNYPMAQWVAIISGLPALFDIEQSFLPDGAIEFSTPLKPEGLPDANHFDTYFGPLTKPIDLSTAQPLACAYPLTPPRVGDFQRVVEAIPDPPPGEGRYYITAVTHGGETRLGRQTSGGRLAGRDASVLPTCTASG